MSIPSGDTPEISIVIPTYNRSALLDRTLAALAAQRYPGERFEVIVADDGSSDDTAELVRSYSQRLRMRYYFQEDLGFRVASARNGGARLASAPLLAFVDTGMLAGPDWVRSHLAAHRDGGAGQIVLGYTYGYNPASPCPEMIDLVGTLPPQEVVDKLADVASFQDMRHPDFIRVGYDLARMAMPWVFLWTLNLSLPTAEFWEAGGFDEEFRGWGVEDIELGYRLHHRGLSMVVSHDAWGIEAPHERQVAANHDSIRRNCLRFLEKHPGIQPELYWAVSHRGLVIPLEEEWEDLLAWSRRARDRDVRAEIEAGTGDLITPPAGGPAPVPEIAVFGCGGRLPDPLVSSGARLTLCDFDDDLLGRVVPAAAAARCTAVAACGMRTTFRDRAFDRVVVTSRLAELWPRWGEFVLAEAARVGREVRVPFLDGDCGGA